MEQSDIRKQILFDAVNSGRICSIEGLVDFMIFLGYQKEITRKVLKMKRIDMDLFNKLGIIIITGGDSK